MQKLEPLQHLLTRGVEKIYPSRTALEKRLGQNELLRVYLGIDPTGPTLHVGHMIQIRKLAEFQKLGHHVILLIGDFTAQIGDPSGKDKSRKPLTHEQVLANCRLYKEQASLFLDFFSKNNPAKLVFNSHWLGPLPLTQVLELGAHITVQHLLERDMFERRMERGLPIYLHEFMYPLMQGYDSVVLNVDVEVCGNDQVFNTLVGRDLVKDYLHKEKFVIANKLLVDPTGKKMGKSEGNMIALTDSPDEMYGKIMAIPDEFLWVHFELLTEIPSSEIQALQEKIKREEENPRDVKAKLAYAIVKMFCDTEHAESAQSRFNAVFQQKEMPSDMPVLFLKKDTLRVHGKISVFELFQAAGFVKSKGEIRRLIQQQGLKINQHIVDNVETDYQHEKELVLQKGKRFFVRVVLE